MLLIWQRKLFPKASPQPAECNSALLRTIIPSFFRPFVPSSFRSIVPSFYRSIVPSFYRSIVLSFHRSLVFISFSPLLPYPILLTFFPFSLRLCVSAIHSSLLSSLCTFYFLLSTNKFGSWFREPV